MKKSILAILIACVCAFAALGVVGCGSSEPSKSSSTEKPAATSEPSVSSSAKKAVDTKPVYALAIGNDSRYMTAEDEEKKIQSTDPAFSDTIMLLRLDPGTNSIAILTVPRDTATEIQGQPFKINDVHYAGGPEALSKWIGEMFGVEIPYYFDLKFVDFANLVDKMGGIKANVPMSLTGGDVITDQDLSVGAGENTLNGHEALMVARQRKVYADNGEAIRQMISREMVANGIQAYASKPESEAAGAAALLETIGTTNMPDDVLTAYIKAFMKNSGDIAFNLGTAPYVGGVDSTGAWRIANDPDTYAKLHEAMESGAALSDIVPNPAV